MLLLFFHFVVIFNLLFSILLLFLNLLLFSICCCFQFVVVFNLLLFSILLLLFYFVVFPFCLFVFKTISIVLLQIRASPFNKFTIFKLLRIVEGFSQNFDFHIFVHNLLNYVISEIQKYIYLPDSKVIIVDIL